MNEKKFYSLKIDNGRFSGYVSVSIIDSNLKSGSKIFHAKDLFNIKTTYDKAFTGEKPNEKNNKKA